jgi:hypothetical protein
MANAIVPANLFENVLWRRDSLRGPETCGFPAKGAPEKGLHRFENHATEKLGDWDAIICTAFANIPKNITAFD